MRKTYIFFGIVCISVIIALYFLTYKKQVSEKYIFTSENQLNTEALSVFTWNIIPIDEQSDIPQSRVSMVYKNKIYELGVFQGSCFRIADSEWEYVSGESDGVICWWAGGGVEIGVFPENNTYSIRKAFIGESENGLSRDSFVELFSLES